MKGKIKRIRRKDKDATIFLSLWYSKKRMGFLLGVESAILCVSFQEPLVAAFVGRYSSRILLNVNSKLKN